MRVGAIVGFSKGKAILISNVDDEFGTQKVLFKQIISSGIAPDGTSLEKVYFLEPTKRKIFSAPEAADEVVAEKKKARKKA